MPKYVYNADTWGFRDNYGDPLTIEWSGHNEIILIVEDQFGQAALSSVTARRVAVALIEAADLIDAKETPNA